MNGMNGWAALVLGLRHRIHLWVTWAAITAVTAADKGGAGPEGSAENPVALGVRGGP